MLKSDYWKERAEAAERLLKRETEQHDWDRIFTPEQRETLRRARNPDSAPEKRDAARDALCDLLDLPHYATNKDVLRGYLKDTEARAARARAEVVEKVLKTVDANALKFANPDSFDAFRDELGSALVSPTTEEA